MITKGESVDLGKWTVNPQTECWEWDMGLTVKGYGRIAREGKSFHAHRWVYTHLVGPIKEGLTLDHLCRVKRCVNPDHMEQVTRRENTLRAWTHRWAAIDAAWTHCPNGHPFSNENTIRTGDRRECLQCHQEGDIL